jgi:hypothetical protein
MVEDSDRREAMRMASAKSPHLAGLGHPLPAGPIITSGAVTREQSFEHFAWNRLVLAENGH